MAQPNQQPEPKDTGPLLSSLGITGPMPTTSGGLRDVRESLLSKKGEAETATAEARRAAAGRREVGEEKLYREERVATEPMRRELLTKIEEKPYPPPTRDNFKNFAGMFSVISALTFAVGGKGRGAGMGALAALNGALEGYNRGEKDAFDRGMKEFDKQLANYKTTLEGTREALRVVADREGLRTREGIAALKRAELNDQGVTAALIRENRFKDAINHIDNLIRKVDAVERQNQAFKDREYLKNLSGQGDLNKPSKEERDRITLRESIIRRIPELISTIEQNRSQLGIKTAFNEQILSRIDVKGVPLRSELAQIDADYRFSKGGKALTRNENEILKGVTDWRGKTPDAIIKQLQALTKSVERDQSVYYDLYPGFMSRLETTRPAAGGQPRTSRAFLNGRAIVVRQGKWVFEDTGEDVPQ